MHTALAGRPLASLLCSIPLALAVQLAAPAPAAAQGWSRTDWSIETNSYLETASVAVRDETSFWFAARYDSVQRDSIHVQVVDAGGNPIEQYRYLGQSDELVAMDIARGPDGNAYLCGRDRGRNHAMLMSIDRDTGAVRWARSFDGDHVSSLQRLVASTDGRLLAVGAHQGPKSGPLVVCFRENGDVDWQGRLSGFSITSVQSSIAPTSKGGCVVAVSGYEPSGGLLTVLMSLSGEGELRWQRRFVHGTGTRIFSVTALTGDEVLIAGNRQDEDFVARPWIARVDATGGVVWEREIQIRGEARRICRSPHGPSLVLSTLRDGSGILLTRVGAGGQSQSQVKLGGPQASSRLESVDLEALPQGGWIATLADNAELAVDRLRLGAAGGLGRCCGDEVADDSAIVQTHTEVSDPGLSFDAVTLDRVAVSVLLREPAVAGEVHCSTNFGAWSDGGGGAPGLHGVPCYAGAGTLDANSPVTSILTRARPFSGATLILGFSRLDAPFRGGQLVPHPDFMIHGLKTDGRGEIRLPTTWPDLFLPGTELYFQYVVQDPSAPRGTALSNAIRAITP